MRRLVAPTDIHLSQPCQIRGRYQRRGRSPCCAASLETCKVAVGGCAASLGAWHGVGSDVIRGLTRAAIYQRHLAMPWLMTAVVQPR